MDDTARERIAMLGGLIDPLVRAREIVADVMEFLHAEILARVEQSVRTRGMSPPYEIDGDTFADPACVTLRLRFETTHIAYVAFSVTYNRGRDTEYPITALRQCNVTLVKFANAIDGLGGLVLRSAYLGQPKTAAVWIEDMISLITTTLVEIEFLAVDRQDNDTLPPPDPEFGKE